MAKLLTQSHTKPPEGSTAGAQNKVLPFTTGCLTNSPHQVGDTKQNLLHQMTIDALNYMTDTSSRGPIRGQHVPVLEEPHQDQLFGFG